MALAKERDQLIEAIGAMSVLELSELVKALEEKFGISGMQLMAAGAAPAASEAASVEDENVLLRVTIKDPGTEKIKVIKALRLIKKDMGLGDAKKAVEECQTIAEGVAKQEADKMKKDLEAAGAKVELTSM